MIEIIRYLVFILFFFNIKLYGIAAHTQKVHPFFPAPAPKQVGSNWVCRYLLPYPNIPVFDLKKIALRNFGTIFSIFRKIVCRMKTRIVLFALGVVLLAGCKSQMPGTEIKTPFSGNRYEGNNRWVRAVASGESMDLETSKDKAMLAAKQRLAGAVQTQIKQVSENYKGERNADGTIDDFNERFQQLTREVMNQVLVEVQTIDEKIFQKPNRNYETWVALEARKKTIYKKLKEQAKRNAALSEKDKAVIEKMIDQAIEDLDDKD